MNRRLSRPEQAQLVEEYQSGKSTFELAHRFGINRHTVAKHLRRRGIVVRGGQVKMTPDVIEHARRLYADGRSLVAIGKQLICSELCQVARGGAVGELPRRRLVAFSRAVW